MKEFYEKLYRAEQQIILADSMSNYFYQKPLAVLYDGSKVSKVTLAICKKILKRYEISSELPLHRLCVGLLVSEDGSKAFVVRGTDKSKDLNYDYLHALEVYKESMINDPVYDCMLITAMKNRGNVMVNPVCEFTKEEIERFYEMECEGA